MAKKTPSKYERRKPSPQEIIFAAIGLIIIVAMVLSLLVNF